MRVLIAASSYPRDEADWKGRFIFDQVAAVARQDLEVMLWAPPGELPPSVQSALTDDDARWFDTLLARGGIAHLLQRRPWAGAWAGWQLLRRLRAACRRTASVDFYLIDWLQNALALPDDGKPAIVTVLGSDFGLLRLPGMAGALRRQFRRRQTVLMPNAEWMAPRLLRLFGDVAKIETNPFGVAPEWFAVTSGIERNGWLVVSRITQHKLGALFDWGEGLFSQQRPLHLLGPIQEKINFPSWAAYHGATNPRELREHWFPGAIGLLTLSRHDEGRPQVLIEAMAAGLPVIASNIPAHADLIHDGVTGWLVNGPAELTQALREAEAPAVATRITAAARAFVADAIGTWNDSARRYCDAFASRPREMSVCAVVVAFHPDANLEVRLGDLLPQVHFLVVVDNTPSNARRRHIRLLAAHEEKFCIIENDDNLGVGTALNQGLEQALQRHCDWLLTLDQDTCCFPDMVQTLLAVRAASVVPPKVIGGNYLDMRSNTTKVADGQAGEFFEQKTVITSGCLVDTSFAREIGGFREDYFIDQLDHEFCLRVRAHGGRVVISRRPVMTHSVGESGGPWLPLLGRLPGHGPVRKYYIARNSLVTIARYWRTEPSWCLRRAVRLMLGLPLMALLERQRTKKVRAFFAGIADGVRGRMGPCRDGRTDVSRRD